MFFDSIKSAYINSSYQNKLIISFCITILVPVILLSYFSYYQNLQVIKTQSIAISELYLHQVESSINTKLTDLANTAKVLSRQTAVTTILEKDPTSVSFSEQLDDLKDLDNIVSTFLSSSPEMYKIRLYVDSKFIYSNRNDTTYNLDSFASTKWAKMVNSFYTDLYFTEPYEYRYILNNIQRIISVIVPIRSSKDFEKIIGVICIDMLEKDILDSMKVADYTSRGQIIITDKNYNPLLIYTTNDKFNLDSINNIIQKNVGANKSENISVINNNVIGMVSLWNTWKLISINSMEDLLAAQSNLKFRFVLSIILTSICVYLLAYFCGKYNAKRIGNLAKQIRIVESGNFNVKCIVDSADEIGDLQTSFNRMIEEIDTLMKNQYQLGKNLNAMEMQVLQAQINPHFLYNTLDLILWTAKRNDMELVCDIVLKLSKFYRISLSNGSNFITLSDEIEHVRLYVELQKLRFSKNIYLYTDICNSLKNYRIMKLLLQPIVENSIIHGITNSDAEHGEIYISATLQGEIIQIVIEDNGIGMDHSTVAKLMSYSEFHTNKEHISGYGLKNVIDRLKLYYDNQSRIIFESTPNIGTKVTIIIPYNYKNENLH
ncbi:sensor histidine kinase [Xylanivirga thermophila]|uniref:sensor histidine kinase n=1 Tax=Xylanivirga thermophila TaxID=2496273 RepID=UPI00101DF9E4|nr:sensor histidine kinase [Xylanivirga thermophila]